MKHYRNVDTGDIIGLNDGAPPKGYKLMTPVEFSKLVKSNHPESIIIENEEKTPAGNGDHLALKESVDSLLITVSALDKRLNSLISEVKSNRKESGYKIDVVEQKLNKIKGVKKWRA